MKKTTKKLNFKSDEKKTKIKKNAKRAYIAVAAAMLIVCGTAYIRHRAETAKNLELAFDESAWEEAVSEVSNDTYYEPQEEEAVYSEDEAEVEEIPSVAEASETFEEEAAAVSAKAEEPTPEPLEGVIIREFSGDELVYQKSTEDWRTHNGLDIKAGEGEKVVSIMDGRVKKVENDELFGVMVEIEHPDGMITRYMGLQSVDFIQVGKDVKKGDIIGGVGKPGILEKEDGPHLHFEILKDDDYVNPVKYF